MSASQELSTARDEDAFDEISGTHVVTLTHRWAWTSTSNRLTLLPLLSWIAFSLAYWDPMNREKQGMLEDGRWRVEWSLVAAITESGSSISHSKSWISTQKGTPLLSSSLWSQFSILHPSAAAEGPVSAVITHCPFLSSFLLPLPISSQQPRKLFLATR